MKWISVPAVVLAFCLLMSGSNDVAAQKASSKNAQQQSIRANGMGSQMLQRSATPRISSQRAASLVKNRYTDSRILGVTAIAEEGLTVYRVRTLSGEGIVKSVFVDGRSGEVFE